MRFSAPVFFDDQENIFLAEGKEIRKFHLQALIRWNIEYVFTYGQLLMKSEDNSEKSLVEELPEVEELENLHELIVNNGGDFNLTEEEIELSRILVY